MRIILEGPDGSGKTTLANSLASKYGLLYHHSSSLTANDYSYHVGLLKTDGYVYDRFYLGEYIYSTLYNRSCKLLPLDYSILTTMVDKYDDTLLVILYSSDTSILVNRLNVRGEDEFIINRINSANDMFKMFGHALLNNKSMILIDIATCENVEQLIIDKLKELQYERDK